MKIKWGNSHALLQGDDEVKSVCLDISGDVEGLTCLSAICKKIASFKSSNSRNKNIFDVTKFLNKGSTKLVLNRIDLANKETPKFYFPYKNIKIRKKHVEWKRNVYRARYYPEKNSSAYSFKMSRGVLFIKTTPYEKLKQAQEAEILGDADGFKYLAEALKKISKMDLTSFYKLCPDSVFGDHFHLDYVLSNRSARLLVFRLDGENSHLQSFYGSEEFSWRVEKREQIDIDLKKI